MRVPPILPVTVRPLTWAARLDYTGQGPAGTAADAAEPSFVNSRSSPPGRICETLRHPFSPGPFKPALRQKSQFMTLSLLLLLGIFVVAPSGLYFALRWIARRWLRNKPAHPYAAKITPWGLVVYACMTVVLLYGCVKYQIQPDSAVGTLLHKPGGVIIALVAVLLMASYLDVFLRKLGRRTSVPVAGSGATPPSAILSPGTSLLTLPDFVPPGFKCGVELLNDNLTPMEFVVSMLSAHLSLPRKEAIRVMLAIHSNGGALLATPTRAEAEAVAGAITTAASLRGYPLVCRAVGFT
jgi:ATP-dependent Clp protease adapter protein ClpS